MNYNGKQIKDAIVRRLNDENIRCYDSAIVAKLVEFGEVDKWLTDRNKLREKQLTKH